MGIVDAVSGDGERCGSRLHAASMKALNVTFDFFDGTLR
jgi:hypothetical protein